jgi:nucleotide-binding universal stress UspA family protein
LFRGEEMYKHLLVPLDGSRLAEAVFPAVAFLAERLAARVTLLHVVERGAPETVHGQRHLTEPIQARAYLEDAARLTLPSTVSVEVHVGAAGEGGVAQSIVRFAAESCADLIVMCSHGHSGLRHLLSGSNAQQLVGCGTISVLQIRPPDEGPDASFSCRKILVPLDGRPEHEEGLEVAAGLSKACQAVLLLLTTVPTLKTLPPERAAAASLMPGAAAAILDVNTVGAEAYLGDKLRSLRTRGVVSESETARGDPAEVILQVAERSAADLIVLGTHRRTGTEAFWSGSVAPRVANRSRTPVLLVPLPVAGTACS